MVIRVKLKYLAQFLIHFLGHSVMFVTINKQTEYLNDLFFITFRTSDRHQQQLTGYGISLQYIIKKNFQQTTKMFTPSKQNNFNTSQATQFSYQPNKTMIILAKQNNFHTSQHNFHTSQAKQFSHQPSKTIFTPPAKQHNFHTSQATQFSYQPSKTIFTPAKLKQNNVHTSQAK